MRWSGDVATGRGVDDTDPALEPVVAGDDEVLVDSAGPVGSVTGAAAVDDVDDPALFLSDASESPVQATPPGRR